MTRKKLQDPTDEFFDTHLKSYIGFERKSSDVATRFLTKFFGSIWFLSASLLVTIVWIAANLGWMPGIAPFDPYPFQLLLMIVVLLAYFLSIVVLISQDRLGRKADIRQQIDFEVNVRAEREITKILNMLSELQGKLGIKKFDEELNKMKEKTDIAKIKEEIEQSQKI